MLLPSDIAPKAKVFDSSSGGFTSLVLTTHNLVFKQDGSMTIILHGIKNDYHQDGFEVNVQPASTANLDLVLALSCYIEHTRNVRPSSCPLFLTLNQPFRVIRASTVSSVLEKSISLAKLDNMGFTVKSFRPTGTTKAIESDIPADSVRRIGRWKSKEVFKEHHVHAFPMLSFIDRIFDIHVNIGIADYDELIMMIMVSNEPDNSPAVLILF